MFLGLPHAEGASLPPEIPKRGRGRASLGHHVGADRCCCRDCRGVGGKKPQQGRRIYSGSGGLWIRYVGNHPSMSFGVRASVSSRSVSGRSANISSQDSFARIRPPSARLDIFARRRRCSTANPSSAMGLGCVECEMSPRPTVMVPWPRNCPVGCRVECNA